MSAHTAPMSSFAMVVGAIEVNELNKRVSLILNQRERKNVEGDDLQAAKDFRQALYQEYQERENPCSGPTVRLWGPGMVTWGCGGCNGS